MKNKVSGVKGSIPKSGMVRILGGVSVYGIVDYGDLGKKIGLRINRKKSQFLKNAYCEDGGVQLEGSQIVEASSFVYLGRSMNMENGLKEELNGRMRAAWAAFAAVREATD
ncbi:hypothetical protein RB195_007577 [Necator americanus]|uniref:Reverse transcriptase domain-containing protein n=1 Tax=Necator americanus TaxID=51031 RepID=A0ABR1C1P9_NECAM